MAEDAASPARHHRPIPAFGRALDTPPLPTPLDVLWRPTALMAVVLGAGLALALGGQAALPVIPAVLVVSLALALSAQARIGGQTGDILGASQQLSFAAALATLA